VPRDQLPVPTQQRLRRHDPRPHELCRKHLSKRGQHQLAKSSTSCTKAGGSFWRGVTDALCVDYVAQAIATLTPDVGTTGRLHDANAPASVCGPTKRRAHQRSRPVPARPPERNDRAPRRPAASWVTSRSQIGRRPIWAP